MKLVSVCIPCPCTLKCKQALSGKKAFSSVQALVLPEPYSHICSFRLCVNSLLLISGKFYLNATFTILHLSRALLSVWQFISTTITIIIIIIIVLRPLSISHAQFSTKQVEGRSSTFFLVSLVMVSGR